MIIKKILYYVGKLWGFTILFPGMILEFNLSIPHMIYIAPIPVNVGIILILFVCIAFCITMLASGFPLIVALGISLMWNAMPMAAVGFQVTALRESINQCGEDFASLNILAGILRPFKVLGAQWSFLQYFLSKMENIGPDEPISPETLCVNPDLSKSNMLIQHEEKMCNALGKQTTAQIITAQIAQSQAQVAEISSILCSVKPGLSAAVANLVINYIFDDFVRHIFDLVKAADIWPNYQRAFCVQNRKNTVTDSEVKGQISSIMTATNQPARFNFRDGSTLERQESTEETPLLERKSFTH